MKRILIVFLLIICLFGCNKKETNENAMAFKLEYESLNGKLNTNGSKIREISIDTDNPFESITTKSLLEKINNKESIYVYFGDPLCPWCRSVLEEAVKVAKENNIEKIYYVKIWDKDGKEILRSKYQLNKKGLPELEIPATDDYYSLLKVFKDLLSDYTLTDDKGKEVKVGEKRIYAPTFIYIEKGLAKKLTTGLSDKQESSIEELTDEVLIDEELKFTEFFTN